MICAHVRDDARRHGGQRVWRGPRVVLCRDPPHHPEFADVVNIDWLQPKEDEV